MATRASDSSAAASMRLAVSLEGQVITAIPATLFMWIIGTGIALLATEH